MKELKSISKQISNKKELEINLPMYSGRMMDLYNKFSTIKLAMNYYTLTEVMKEATKHDEHIFDIYSSVNEIIDKYIVNREAVCDEKHISVLNSVREDIITHMEVVTSFVDKFQIYEYVLNRIEYRFDDTEFSSEYYENRFTNDIIHYIIKDKETVNAKVSEIIAQLPIRITKTKFYERIREAFSLYKDGQKESFEDFVYMIRTISMLYKPEGFDEFYPELLEVLNSFLDEDFKEISEENYRQLKDKLTYSIQNVTKKSDLYVMLQEIVNDIFIIMLSSNYAYYDDEKINVLMDSIRMINAYALGKSPELDIDSITATFTDIEGKQEDIYGKLSSNDYIIDDFKNDDILKSLCIENQFTALEMITKLSSNSIFIKLHKEADESTVDDEYLDKEYEKLVAEFDGLFDGMPVIIRRAVMSNVLSVLPNFFRNVDEMQIYINVSLSQCNDVSERRACVNLIKQIIFAENE